MKDKIIIALDFNNFNDAKNMVDMVGDASFFKVGLQSFLSFGYGITDYIQQNNKKLFLDLKFKDIPNTVEGAVKSVLKFNPDFLTIHTTGGAEMIKRAVETAKENPTLKVLGVTILTSLENDDLEAQGVTYNVNDTVLKLCEMGLKNGLNSFVCSPKEITVLKKTFGNDISLITPGIRPDWSKKGDQKRVFTPKMAIDAGSDYMVIGRPITQNENPNNAFNMILKEIVK
jgi:orotidine-5'-phosphate decarboxylase